MAHNTGDSSGDPPSSATGGGGKDSSDGMRSSEMALTTTRSTAQQRFFCGSGDLLLRQDQIPFNLIGTLFLPICALFLPPISAGDT
ncbi:hypothetical protein MRB53_023415 [Persea americana]|uniref:Uncharacterized protein n=1 Tax=Persea americana TaxID=3435 RepID=A0ACC2LAJ9_PERAE|nr:hypothetical protein MRB53_023415 [Persea americana]